MSYANLENLGALVFQLLGIVLVSFLVYSVISIFLAGHILISSIVAFLIYFVGSYIYINLII